MWQFAEDGELFFEKAVNKFAKQLFHRWQELGTNHALVIIFFSRLYYPSHWQPPLGQHCHTERDGRKYQDFYQVICDEQKSDWNSFLLMLKKEFMAYPSRIKWNPYADSNSAISNQINNDSSPTGEAVNSTATQGNFLEAVNLALSVFDKVSNSKQTRIHNTCIIIIISMAPPCLFFFFFFLFMYHVSTALH
jgi:hypothetical protein